MAKEAGVSITSASLVLNNRPMRVSKKKRAAILDAAKQLNYVPNQTARSLATNRSMLLALIVPDIQNLFFASLAKSLEDSVSKHGYTLIIANSDDSAVEEHNILQRLEARGIDGLFLVPSLESVADSKGLHKDVSRLYFPVVLGDRLVDEQWCDAVGSDNFMGGELAARFFIAQGHRKIACISGTNGSGNMNARKSGFVSGLEKAGLQLDPSLDCDGDYHFSSGYRQADHIIDQGATAVFCGNDLMALGFIKRLNERQLKCPQDCSVIGYDDVAGCLGLESELTTIDQDINSVALACSDCMMSRLEQLASDDHGEDKKARGKKKSQLWLKQPRQYLVQPKLVENATVYTF
ncbi:LacI family DNA-binding transcriptional regulator [Bifidobacterium sp. ESL0728]|uniref:LacI family DNA-binding transcriptional regulator n=1 Tax=Bifidobacterium sp. ESL0728 TaxID=2983220 RepID=UPI0023F89E64|nr:LacI family DNA-binding transcriptional regulator [Bifidobacterium sp. ESL0728]WEV59218.1 LacI family DNA-binding transcriptional regulator [Bifidobacterium sp. ESL0728]